MNILNLKKKPLLIFLNYTILPNFKFVTLTSSEIFSGQAKKKKNHCVLIYKIYCYNLEEIKINYNMILRLQLKSGVSIVGCLHKSFNSTIKI